MDSIIRPRTRRSAKESRADKPYDGFHVFAPNWDAKRMVFTYDGTPVISYESDGVTSWPFDKPKYQILNLAIGGE